MLIDNKIHGQNILCYMRGTHHFDLFHNIFVSNPDINFFVCSDKITDDEYQHSVLCQIKNVKFISSFRNIMFKLDAFGLFISTDCQAAPAHVMGLRIANVCHRLGIPVAELQHGMFQLGLHYADAMSQGVFVDDSLYSASFADNVLTYYTPDTNAENTCCIGYPPYIGKTESYIGEYVLVLSNLHWSTYTHAELYNFYLSVITYAEQNPNTTIVWKMHHGEIVNAKCKRTLQGLMAEHPAVAHNLIIYHDNKMLKFVSLSDLIAKSRFVISTISTVLLDCELHAKPTVVFRSPATMFLYNKLKSATGFSDATELCALTDKDITTLDTGKLLPYNNDAFRKFVSEKYARTTMSRSEILSVILSELDYFKDK